MIKRIPQEEEEEEIKGPRLLGRLRRRRRSKVDDYFKLIPPKTLCTSPPPFLSEDDIDDVADAISVVSAEDTLLPNEQKWRDPYDPPPIVDQRTVLVMGFLVFGLSLIWPPLILLLAYVASKLIPYSFRVNDDATQRRKLFAEFMRNAQDLPEGFTTTRENVQQEHSYWSNERGMLLHTVTMVPKDDKPIQAVVCYCHGYADNISFGKLVEYQRLVEQGIALVALEYEGHGLSDGSMALINDWNTLIDDVTGFFSMISKQGRFAHLPCFIMGESMGGAVAYSTYNRLPQLFRGVVFVCPMCKISNEMLPPQSVIDFLRWLIGSAGNHQHQHHQQEASFLGCLPIAPSKNSLANAGHRVQAKRELLARSPLSFGRNPRLATARELINVTQRISGSLQDFKAPFLVLHGQADVVTDPHLSQALYEESKSTDKSIRLYPGMWHALMSGEPDENIDLVFSDCIKWILERSS